METMTVQKVCQWCGEPAIVRVLAADYFRWKNGELAQRAFPEMRPEDREMLISGTHPKCWDEMFAPEDDEDYSEDEEDYE